MFSTNLVRKTLVFLGTFLASPCKHSLAASGCHPFPLDVDIDTTGENTGVVEPILDCAYNLRWGPVYEGSVVIQNLHDYEGVAGEVADVHQDPVAPNVGVNALDETKTNDSASFVGVRCWGAA